MIFYLTLPLNFLRFWYYEAPRGLLDFFTSLNSAFLKLFSLPLLLRTYFEPWKSEYRPGLVAFSRFMGMFVKSWVIMADLIFLIPLLTVEFIVFAGFLLWPVVTILLLVI